MKKDFTGIKVTLSYIILESKNDMVRQIANCIFDHILDSHIESLEEVLDYVGLVKCYIEDNITMTKSVDFIADERAVMEMLNSITREFAA